MSNDLFPEARARVPLDPGAVLLGGFALPEADALLAAIEAVAADAPFRRWLTRRGQMSVAMTNAGALGWISDRRGYRYDPVDPDSGRRWPPLPPVFADLAARAAAAAGFAGFAPDACLINRYDAGSKLALHQDRDESGFGQPIVSVSLGAPAVFLWGGLARDDTVRRVPLEHGDVVVWGGPARLAFHGIAELKAGTRYNLTFRKAG